MAKICAGDQPLAAVLLAATSSFALAILAPSCTLFCDRLIVCGLKRSRIDLRQEIARPDVLAFGEGDLHQFAIDPRFDRDRIECLHRTKTGEIDWDIAPLRRGDRHRDGRRAQMLPPRRVLAVA